MCKVARVSEEGGGGEMGRMRGVFCKVADS